MLNELKGQVRSWAQRAVRSPISYGDYSRFHNDPLLTSALKHSYGMATLQLRLSDLLLLSEPEIFSAASWMRDGVFGQADKAGLRLTRAAMNFLDPRQPCFALGHEVGHGQGLRVSTQRYGCVDTTLTGEGEGILDLEAVCRMPRYGVTPTELAFSRSNPRTLSEDDAVGALRSAGETGNQLLVSIIRARIFHRLHHDNEGNIVPWSEL